MKIRKGLIGYLMVLLGILIPLVLVTNMALRSLRAPGAYEDFRKAQADLGPEEVQAREEALAAYNATIQAQGDRLVADPFTWEGLDPAYDLGGLEAGGVLAYLVIPRLDLKKPVHLGASQSNLAKGPSQVEGTDLPLGGPSTRSVIAGHRGGYNDLDFLNVDYLEPGDRVYLDRGFEVLAYEVGDFEVIGPHDGDLLGPLEGYDTLTLLTCTPKAPPRPNRLLVNCYRVQEDDAPVQAQDMEGIIKEAQPDKRARAIYLALYGAAVLGWVIFVVVLVRFVGYLRGRD